MFGWGGGGGGREAGGRGEGRGGCAKQRLENNFSRYKHSVNPNTARKKLKFSS